METAAQKVPAGPKDVFLHLLAIGTLYVSVVHFLILLFRYIDRIFPDKLSSYPYAALADTVRSSTAILIIVFPVFLFTSFLIERDIRHEPGRAQVWVRRWLLYLTLFIAAITIITDLVILVQSFLNGEITAHFLLKVLAVFLVAAAVFGYEFWDLRRQSFTHSTVTTRSALLASAIVLAAVVVGFFVMGSPFYQRDVRFDERRVTDLQTVQSQVVNYWQNKNRLPAKLDDLKDDISGFVPPTDPETDAPYEYRIVKPLTFEVCAAFKTASPANDDGLSRSVPYLSPAGTQESWKHAAGRTCFSRTIDPDLYRKQVIPPPPKG